MSNEIGSKKTDIVIIGGGPGGYVAAIRAAQLGAKVTLIEKEKIGGTCLNVGCIPTKALLHSAEIVDMAEKSVQFGIKIKGVEIDWEQVQSYKNEVSKKLSNGVKILLKSRKVKVISGSAVLLPNKKVKVATDKGEEVLSPDYIIIATGSVPAMPPIKGIRGNEDCLDSTACLELETIPESMIVVGGGVIGVELASAYSKFGTKITIVEMAPNILPSIDVDMSDVVKKSLISMGVDIYTNASVEEIIKLGNGSKAMIKLADQAISTTADKVLIAVGRRPQTAELNLEAAGISMNRAAISVNDEFETSVKGVFAIGDCVGQIMLAHTASAMGEYVVEKIMGEEAEYYANTNPAGVYTTPEIASVGLSEAEAKAKGIAYEVGRFDMMSNGKSLILGSTEGFVKVLVGKEHKEILGVHIVSEKATELIAEAGLAIRLEATIEEFTSTIHAHPTISEAMREGVLAADKRAIHAK